MILKRHGIGTVQRKAQIPDSKKYRLIAARLNLFSRILICILRENAYVSCLLAENVGVSEKNVGVPEKKSVTPSSEISTEWIYLMLFAFQASRTFPKTAVQISHSWKRLLLPQLSLLQVVQSKVSSFRDPLDTQLFTQGLAPLWGAEKLFRRIMDTPRKSLYLVPPLYAFTFLLASSPSLVKQANNGFVPKGSWNG